MSVACPLNFKKVDANVNRFSALFVAALVGLYLYTTNVYILYFLTFDFVMKLFLNRGISPISMLAEFFKGVFKIKDHLVDGGAKRLAGLFGLLFVLLLIVTHYLDLWSASLGVAIVFLACSLLDVFFGFCIACHIYFIIKKIYPNFMNNL